MCYTQLVNTKRQSGRVAVMEKLSTRLRVAGIKQTRAAVEAGRADAVYIAEDAEPSAVGGIAALCREKGIEVIYVPTRRELAKACRIDVPCAAAARLSETDK